MYPHPLTVLPLGTRTASESLEFLSMNSAPTLSTAHLTLRQTRTSDAGDVFRNYAQNPNVTRYLTWSVHKDVGDSHAFIATLLEELKEGKTLPWMITLRGREPEVVGMIAAHISGHKAMIGYVLAQEHWGLGYMSESLTAVLNYLRDARPDLVRLWAFCDVDNVGSARVMTNAGMEREGILRAWATNSDDRPVDCVVYSWVRRQ